MSDLPRLRSCLFPLLLWMCVVLGSKSTLAGGGPENLFLVVNSNSEASKTVANHYIDLRKIPPVNVFYLNFRADRIQVPSGIFRTRILEPIFREIEKRGIKDRIDYIAYSSDFPWRVNFKEDFTDENSTRVVAPTGSLTSATFLHAFVMQKRKEIVSLNANFYCSPPNDLVAVSRACRSSYRWSLGGRRAGKDGLPYMLSAMLGVTKDGNTTAEIATYLERAAKADGTSPPGTIYYAKNKTIRSTVRDRDFAQAVRLLRLAGVQAEVVEGFFPQYKQDIAGVTCGHSVVNPLKSQSKILPGAFCDNLTSAGGQFLPKKYQTPLTEFLQMGAAGACGTVVEPRAIPQKFPNYTNQVHYAHGCSLAESFYQSVSCPYQQILVGDPLCQPWAKIPKVSVDGISDGGMVKGAVTITPTAAIAQGTASAFEMFVDGLSVQKCAPGEKITWDTTKFADGPHEVRIVAWDNTPIETQGRWLGTVVVKNGTEAMQLSVDENSLPIAVQSLKLNLTTTTGTAAKIMFNGLKLAEVESGNGAVSIDKAKLGKGPITLIAVADGSPGLRSRPLRLVLPEK